MAGIIDTEENSSLNDHRAIVKHLEKRRPFATVFDQLPTVEKDDPVAVKFMFVVDYNVQQCDLYNRIAAAANSKLLTQLMLFHSYGKFKNYEYQVGQKIRKRLLKCKFCELIGLYGCILTHMAISHDAHISLKTCAYCNRVDLRTHFNDDSLEQCYAHYLDCNSIEVDELVCSIVTDFYAMLRTLAINFSINTQRNYNFTGKGHKAVERCGRGGNYDIDTDENVTKSNRKIFPDT